MNENQNLVGILKILDKNGILQHSILIGSWCLHFYEMIFENFKQSLTTSDIDFYVDNPKKVTKTGNIFLDFEENDYLSRHDSMTGKTTFYSLQGFEIEFLTKLNREMSSTVMIGNTGIKAESLTYVDIFSSNYIEVMYQGMNVKVASPSAYILQKLLISKRRKIEKAKKDIMTVSMVLEQVKSRPLFYSDLRRLYDSLPKKWKKEIDSICSMNEINLF